MGSQGKHVARSRSSSVTHLGKHAAAERQRPRMLTLVVAAVALSTLVAGGLLAFRLTAPTSSAARATGAVTVASDKSADKLAAVELSVPGIERLVVYGHSMPEGGGASEPSRSYAVLTAEALGVELVNRAVGGSGAANATKTMQAARPAGPNDAVVLHTGMNDIFRRGDAAVGRGRQAILSFLAGTADAGRRVIVLECQPGSWKYTPKGRNLQTAYDAWNDMLREEAAGSQDVRVLDTCAAWNPRRFTSLEKYHPNDEGHARMADELAALLAMS